MPEEVAAAAYLSPPDCAPHGSLYNRSDARTGARYRGRLGHAAGEFLEVDRTLYLDYVGHYVPQRVWGSLVELPVEGYLDIRRLVLGNGGYLGGGEIRIAHDVGGSALGAVPILLRRFAVELRLFDGTHQALNLSLRVPEPVSTPYAVDAP